jgi:hypothetical protein
MTATRFGAPMPTSPARFPALPPYARRDGIAFRLVRLVWLTARFGRPEPVTFDECRGRFGVSLRSFHRDVALLRQAGLYIDTVLPGNYRMLCFLADADQARGGIAR